MHITPLNHPLSLAGFQSLALAGGGNRCFWQAGLVSHLKSLGWVLPQQISGTSAGAATGASILLDREWEATQNCWELFSRCHKLWQRATAPGQSGHFAHHEIYPAWLASFLKEADWPRLVRGPRELWVGICRPTPALGLKLSTALGLLAYLADKKLAHSIHPRLPRWLGLRMEFLGLHRGASWQDGLAILRGAAAAPPFLKATQLGGRWALDGGFVDNAPVYPGQGSSTKTLVLLTRHYPGLPTLFRMGRQFYWQASRKIPVSTFDCTRKTDVRPVFDLGEHDARAALKAGLVRL